MIWVLKILKPFALYIALFGLGWFISYNQSNGKINSLKKDYEKKVYNLHRQVESLSKDTSFYISTIKQEIKRSESYIEKLSKCNNVTIGKVKTKDGIAIVDIKQEIKNDSTRRVGFFKRVFKRKNQ